MVCSQVGHSATGVSKMRKMRIGKLKMETYIPKELGGEPNVVAIVIAGVAIAAALRYAALYFGVF